MNTDNMIIFICVNLRLSAVSHKTTRLTSRNSTAIVATMNKKGSTRFDQIRLDVENNDVAAALDKLVVTLKAERKYHQLFEALKIQLRHRLNLPLVNSAPTEKLDSENQAEFESGLLDACRTVGLLLVADQKLREAWVYLQPLDDRKLFRTLLEKYQINDNNADEVIDIALMQLAAPTVGYQLVLERYGTCNAITSFESSVHGFDATTRAELAGLLVDHLYGELTDSLKNCLTENEIATDGEFIDLVTAHEELLASKGPLVDATHLSSTLRIGRDTTERDSHLKLCEMAQYGCLLDEPYRFPGEAPFENTFRDHLIFYRALTAEDPNSETVTEAIQFFDKRSLAAAGDPFNPIPDEVFVDLLYRLGRNSQAIEVSLERLAKRTERAGIAPPIHQMATEAEHFKMLQDYYLKENDLLGFTVSVLTDSSG